MRTFTESRLDFTFDDNWRVELWDQQPAYRAPGAFSALEGTAACDFIGMHAVAGAFLIEVKNFTDYHHANKHKLESDAWAETLAGKVRDTLAGAFWTRGRAGDRAPVADLIAGTIDSLIQAPPALTVVFWVDDRPALKPADAVALRTAIRRYLKPWFKLRKVVVTSCAYFEPDQIPGLTVRSRV